MGGLRDRAVLRCARSSSWARLCRLSRLGLYAGSFAGTLWTWRSSQKSNLELELRRGSEADEGKPLPLHKLNPVPDIVAWACSFCLYAGIVVSAHPSKAKDLWAYLATLLAGAERGDWWRAYDSRFRQQHPALERADFGKLDQALFTRTMMSPSPSAPRGAQRGGPTSGVEGRPAPVQKRRKDCRLLRLE